MKIIITKKQYKDLMFSLIDTITGGDLSIDDEPDGYYDVIDFFGNEVMSIIYSKKSGRSRGWKNDLSLTGYFVRDLEKYVPYYKHKMFSKVLVDYVYEKTNIKCDCVDYFYFEGNDSDNKRFVYNLKKKKRIKESVNERSKLDEIIYKIIDEDFYPDYNWNSDLYKDEIERWGVIDFYINDDLAYVYYDDKILVIEPFISEKLNSMFNDTWKPVFKKWFEEKSKLIVYKLETLNNI